MGGMHKYLLFFLLAAFALPFLPIWPGGKPLMNWTPPKNLSTPPLPDVSKVKDMLGSTPESDASKTGGQEVKKKIYKYRDASGKLVLSDTKPPEGVAFTTMATNTPSNVIPTPKPPTPTAAADKGGKSGSSPTKPSGEVDLSYSPERIGKMVDDAKNMEKMLNDRKGAMDKALDGG